VTDPKARRRRLIKVAALAGGALAILCHFVPPDYQDACRAVIKATSTLVSGGCS
jgi:hypothetical protein